MTRFALAELAQLKQQQQMASRSMLQAFAAAAALSAAAAPPAAASHQQWLNLTVYHANQANYTAGDIADMNTADALGDLEFTVRSKLLPIECSDPRMAHRASYDCANPEQDAADIAITKLILSVNASFVPDGMSNGYCPCNVHAGMYSCRGFDGSCAGFGSIPVKAFLGRFYNASHYNSSSPNYDWWGINTLNRFGKGFWYSTVGGERCTDAKLAAGQGCAWKVAEVVKRVSRNCSDAIQEAAVYAADTASGKDCFAKCGQPLNKTSVCWVDCYYRTLLGGGAGERVVAMTDGIAVAEVVAAWDTAFDSDDPAEGGCPNI